MKNNIKIAIVGIGYVGLSLATLLGQKNEVVALDVIPKKVEMVNNKISPIKDLYIENFLENKEINLRATLDYRECFYDAKFIIICTPTNYDDKENCFDTCSVEDIIKKVISMNLETTIIVKSTVPVGFIESMKRRYNINNIFFSPEFLREGKALYDNLYPSRIIVGEKSERAEEFVYLLKEGALKKDIPVKYMNSTEAEAVKLFSNTYLALRIAYFNELDTYAETKKLNTRDIIEGVCLDSRIGNYYNNPSFGYGGYCLPKDTKQLKTNYRNIPENIISAIVNSNTTRKEYIVHNILKNNPNIIGIYKIAMKKDSDNFRFSAIQDIIKILKKKNKKVIIYDPIIHKDEFENCKVVNDLQDFKKMSSIIIANRYEKELDDVNEKVYTRDIFTRD